MTPHAESAVEEFDCLVIGGGPAGLTAAIYLARFHLGVAVIDAGHSRAASIPCTRNHAGFPRGISGRDLLARMDEQAALYGARPHRGRVTSLEIDPTGGFLARGDDKAWRAQTVLLATGVVNHRPPYLSEELHARALANGQIRYCPVCDGFEVTDKRVAVMGTGARGFKEALFVRSFTANVCLISPGDVHDLNEAERLALADAGVTLAERCIGIDLEENAIALTLARETRRFDSLYPALGSDIRSELARGVGAATSRDGCLTVDAHQRTNVAGLYAAGDVVLGLDQISHAVGEGGVAATTIRNDLARYRTLWR